MFRMNNTRPLPESANPSELKKIKGKVSRQEIPNNTEADITRTSNISIIYADSVLVKGNHLIPAFNPSAPQEELPKLSKHPQEIELANRDNKSEKDATNTKSEQEQNLAVCAESGCGLLKPEVCRECGQLKSAREICRECGQVVPKACRVCGQCFSYNLSCREMEAYAQYHLEMEHDTHYSDWSSSGNSSCCASTSRKVAYREEDSMYSIDDCPCKDCQRERKKYMNKPCIISDSTTVIRKSPWGKFRDCLFGKSKKPNPVPKPPDPSVGPNESREEKNSSAQPAVKSVN